MSDAAPQDADPAELAIEELLGAPTVVDDDALPDLDMVRLDRLADDLAIDISEKPVIAARYGLTLRQLYKLCLKPGFRRTVREKRDAWLSDKGAVERFRQYIATGLADAAPSLLAPLNDPNVPFAQKIEAVKTYGKVSGIDTSGRQERAAGFGGASVFAVNINLGNGRVEQFSITPTPPPPDTPVIEGAAEAA